MTTSTDICNVAMGFAKQDTAIVNLETDTSVAAQRCRRFYKPTKASVLQMFPWPFARSVVYLATKDVVSVAGYTYVYYYPAQASNLESVSPPGIDSEKTSLRSDYAIFLSADKKEKEIHTNIQQAKAEITNLITNETVFDQLISDLISSLLAVRLGHVYKLKSSDMNDVKEIYAFQRNEAEKAHANEDLRTQNEPNPYVEARGS